MSTYAIRNSPPALPHYLIKSVQFTGKHVKTVWIKGTGCTLQIFASFYKGDYFCGFLHKTLSEKESALNEKKMHPSGSNFSF